MAIYLIDRHATKRSLFAAGVVGCPSATQQDSGRPGTAPRDVSDRFEQNVHAGQLWAAYMYRVIVDEDQRLTEAS